MQVINPSEREVQLERKVKVLEARIQELHNEKQSSIVQSHEENKRLCINNQLLQDEIAALGKAKN